jgi:hypothetical protein
MNTLRQCAWVLAFGAVCVSSAHAEEFQVAIPGAGLVIKFDAPRIAQFQGERHGDRFRFMATGENRGFVTSLFMEPRKPGADSAACRAEYWSQGSRNPAIVKESTKQLEIGGRPAVSYLLEGDVGGKRVRSLHVNVYAVQGSSCFDFHVSLTPNDGQSEDDVAAVAASLQFESVVGGRR